MGVEEENEKLKIKFVRDRGLLCTFFVMAVTVVVVNIPPIINFFCGAIISII